MANNPLNIFVSKDAVFSFSSDLSITLPPYIDTVLGGSFKNVGLTSDSGEELERSVTTESINAHQLVNARVIVTEATLTLAFESIEDNPAVNELYWGAVLNEDGPTTLKQDAARYVTGVYDTIDTDEGYEKHTRLSGRALVTPNGTLTNERGQETRFPLLVTFQGDYVITKTAQSS